RQAGPVALRLDEHVEHGCRLALEDLATGDRQDRSLDAHALADHAHGRRGGADRPRDLDPAGGDRLAGARHGGGRGGMTPHEARGATATAPEAELRSELILEIERQVVLMASRGEMHAVADPPEEIERVIEVRHMLIAEHTDRDQLAEGVDLELDLRHP